VVGSTGTEAAGWALALGTIGAICAVAAFCTFVATMSTFEIARRRLPDSAAGLVAGVVALLVFFLGGWLVVPLWWTAARGTRLVQRFVA
jgi:hypothetical protein